MSDRYTLHLGDCREVLAAMPAESVDAVVTDPPYGLGFMGKDWDHAVPGEHFWQEAIRVAKPGAHLLAFGGTRTFHRLMAAIEDAGWELRDTLGWVYGSGFPKSHNGPWGGTALKPAWEPIILARKPLVGTVAANTLAHGTGGLNIDGCRIATAGEDNPSIERRNGSTNHLSTRSAAESEAAGKIESRQSPEAYARPRPGDHLGRWPANLIHDGSEEVLAVFPDAPGQQGDLTGNEPSTPFKNAYGVMGRAPAAQARGDTGSAARFFYCAKASREDRNDGCDDLAAKPLNWSSGTQSPGTFQAEGTNRAAQNNHPTVKPTDLMRYLCRLVTPPGGVILDPFMGSGSTGRGALLDGFRFVGIEISPDYHAIAARRIAEATRQGDIFHQETKA